MTDHPDLFAALAAPFDSTEVKVRSISGRQIHYVTARTAMNRLDNVLGPENWWDRFVPGEDSVLCELTIRLPNGTTISKCDAGGYPGMADEGDDDKAGFSDSFKRAAVKWGIARYLYRDGVPDFVQERTSAVPSPAPKPAPAAERQKPRERPQDAPGAIAAPAVANGSQGANGRAKPRQEWAGAADAGAPSRARAKAPAPAPPDVETHAPDDRGRAKAPQSGRALWAWLKEQENERDAGLVQAMTAWGKREGHPARMVDWGAAAIVAGYAEACRRLDAAGGA